jgi:hypothetical protein
MSRSAEEGQGLLGESAMGDLSDERNDGEALEAAGYTSARGAVVFCLVLALAGALFGSVVFAIGLNVLAGPGHDTLTAAGGAAAGAVLGIVVGAVKVWQGNIEAREILDDKEWRRLVRRQTGR